MLDKPRRPFVIRIALTLAGAVLALTGVVGLVVPIMPGWLLIVPGLAILAGEFVWARRLLDGTRHRIERFRSIRTSDQRRAA